MTKDLFRNGVILPVLDAPAVPSVPAPLLLVLGLLLLDGESREVLAELEAARPVQVRVPLSISMKLSNIFKLFPTMFGTIFKTYRMLAKA